ncbi:tetratricopeptide repeat protein [Nocardia sp. NPDC046763]|uniref:tetratricopeptide repeat protein n=1 Tax=Nocardia sp. NPDC046763 TaxID=3155256 RepID=UPI0033ED5751
MGEVYHGLGIVLQDKGSLDEADEFLRKSLAIVQRAGDKDAEASSLHHLAKSAYGRGRFGDAEQLFRQAIILTEEANDRVGLASSYFELGVTRQRSQ